MKYLTIILLFIFTANISHAIETEASFAVLMDAESGQILFEKNAHEKMAPSSMSKIVTALVVFDQLQKGHIKMTDEFINSEKGWKAEGSRMFIPLNAKVTVNQLLKGLLIQSGNDAAITLAEGISGSEDEFANLMNEYAKKIGLANSNFTNASGLPNDNHYTSAYDLAKIAQYTIINFPEYYPMYKETEFEYNKIRQENRNSLLYRYNGADGLKTGHTDDAGYGLVASAVKGNRRLIVTVNGLKSPKQRLIECEKLLNYGFLNYTNIKVAEQNKKIAEIKVKYGTQDLIEVKSNQDIILSLTKADLNNTKIFVEYNEPLTAPVKKDDVIANIIVQNQTNNVKYEYPIYAQEDIAKSGILKAILQNFRYFLFD